jgi:hypothetical protein
VWPQSLKTLVALMLASRQPMFIAWGHEHQLWLYNDAFIPIMGAKHPAMLGRHALREVWGEASDALGPLFGRVFAGEPVHMEDFSLELDRRGNWRIKGQPIANMALREFIGRNYAADEKGRWYFQNGPQRVYVSLAYTPLVVHYEGEALFDHCGRPFAKSEAYVDDEGSVLFAGGLSIALLDDRDLFHIADVAAGFPVVKRSEIERRFGFRREPAAE